MLGPGNEDAAREACAAWPGELQVGGGLTAENVASWVRGGAGKVRSVKFFSILEYSSPFMRRRGGRRRIIL